MVTAFLLYPQGGGVQYLGYSLLLLAIAGAGYVAYWTIRSRKLYEGLFLALALLYPFGVGCDNTNIGPAFFQFWLADIGFTAAWTYLLTASLLERKRLKSRAKRIRQMIRVINTRFTVLLACLLFASVYEVCSTYIVRLLEYLPSAVTVQIDGFDPWDILASFVGSALGWWLLLLQKNWLLRWLPRARELDAQDEAAHKVASPTSKKLRKKRRREG